MNLWNALDVVPIVGTVKNTLEGLRAAVDGDIGRATEKFAFAVVGGTLDVMTLGAGSSLLNLGAKEGVKMVAKKGVEITAKEGVKMVAKKGVEITAKEGVKMVAKLGVKITANQVACNVAGRVACRNVSDAVRSHILYEELADIRYQNRSRRRQDDDDDGDRRNNETQRSSKRGEHVINNNVLKFYRDVVRKFVNDVMHDNLDTMIER